MSAKKQVDGKARVSFLYFYCGTAVKRQEENVFHSLNYKLLNSPFLIVPNIVIEAKYTLAKFINFSH